MTSEVKWPYLNDLFIFLDILPDIASNFHVGHLHLLLKNLKGHEIKNRDYIRRVVFELLIESSLVLKNVIAVNFKGVIFCFSHVFEFADVEWLSHKLLIPSESILIIFNHNKSQQKLFEPILKVVGINICTP